ncbi:MAG TPA: YceI family protein [Gemmatimonadaceae bacterium]|nr:YceI family protein [Gemmatimonadaceae bacterium]
MTVALLAAPLLALSLLAGSTVHAQPATTPAQAPTPVGSSTWTIDVSHSDVTFRIRHLVSRVTGTFNEWKGSIVADPQAWENASIDVAIQTASIDTRNERRDNDLRSNNFFDAANHPVISFRSTKVERTGDKAKIHGELTMKGVTRPVVLAGTLTGLAMPATGRARVGFEASTTVNRLDYGITWNRAAEGGGALLGDDVEISINVEAIRQQ